MPSSRFLIASNTLSSTTAAVTFSSIPSTYTDLSLRMSVRSGDTSGADYFFTLRLNGDTSSLYSSTRMQGNGASVTSTRMSSATFIYGGSATAGTATSNTFGSTEIYIPSYTTTQNRVTSGDTAQETNATNAFRLAIGGLYRDTTAVSSITITDGSGVGFVSGSSFFLYGIKNS